MPPVLRHVLAVPVILAIVAATAGCRQADGPLPTPTADQSNEIGDIARNMINIANKDPQGLEDLRSDLGKYAPSAEAAPRIDELATAIAQGLAGARLTDEAARDLAQVLWVALNGKQLSERQADALGREVRTVLSATGMPEERAQSIADRLGDVQRVVTENRRRWYQVF